MAKWSLKNRDSDNKPPDMPPAAENYYRAEKRDRMIGVWLLGIATLVVTAILAFLLFLGGRWVYRQFTDDTPAPETSQTETTGAPEESTEGQGGGLTDTNGDQTTDETESGPEGQTEGETDETGEGVVSDEAANTDLPNTGPADTLALFVGVTIIATLVHRTVIAKETR